MAWPNPRIPPTEKRLIDIALEGKSDEFKQRVWQIVAETDITGDDPTFLLLVALGRMEAYLDDIPTKLDRQVEQLRQLTTHAIATARMLNGQEIKQPPGYPLDRQQPRQHFSHSAQDAAANYRLLLVAVGASVLLSLVALFIPFVLILKGSNQC